MEDTMCHASGCEFGKKIDSSLCRNTHECFQGKLILASGSPWDILIERAVTLLCGLVVRMLASSPLADPAACANAPALTGY
jgi:hypothetical protein